MFDVGDLPVLTFGNCVLKAEWLSGLWNCTYVFKRFFQNPKNMTFYIFELLHTFSQTLLLTVDSLYVQFHWQRCIHFNILFCFNSLPSQTFLLQCSFAWCQKIIFQQLLWLLICGSFLHEIMWCAFRIVLCCVNRLFAAFMDKNAWIYHFWCAQ